MAASVATNAGEAGRPRSGGGWLLWFGLLGGALAWTGHLALAWLIAEFGCIAGAPAFEWLGVGGITWLILLATVLMAVIAAGATVAGWLLAKRVGPPPPGGTDPDPKPYLARLGWVMSGVFLLVIVVQGMPLIWFLRSCS